MPQMSRVEFYGIAKPKICNMRKQEKVQTLKFKYLKLPINKYKYCKTLNYDLK